MRLWHQDLIHYLDDKRLLGQHCECCALRGKSWGKTHSVVNYVFQHPYSVLYYYHVMVMNELRNRNFKVDHAWMIYNYQGKNIGYDTPNDNEFYLSLGKYLKNHPYDSSTGTYLAYLEHNDKYLLACIDNLSSKNTELINGKTIDQIKLQLAIKGVIS